MPGVDTNFVRVPIARWLDRCAPVATGPPGDPQGCAPRPALKQAGAYRAKKR